MRICFIFGIAWPEFYFEIWDEPGYTQLFEISTLTWRRHIKRLWSKLRK